MSAADYRILSTRALDAALVRKAAQHGIIAVVKDFITIRITPSLTTASTVREAWREGGYRVFTSPNAVQAVKEHAAAGSGEQPEPGGNGVVFCLEGKTFAAVQQLFPQQPVAGKAPTASALAGRILSDPRIRSVTFFCGDQRRPELPEQLQAAGIAVKEIRVYETIPVPAVMEEVYDGILFFSPSAVKSFFSNNRLPPETVCFTIGHTTARAVKEHTGNHVIVSPAQNAAVLTDTVIHYFENITNERIEK